MPCGGGDGERDGEPPRDFEPAAGGEGELPRDLDFLEPAAGGGGELPRDFDFAAARGGEPQATLCR